MSDRRRDIENVRAILTKGMSGVTLASFFWLIGMLLAGVAFMAAAFSVTGEEDLVLASPWMRAVQCSFILGVVLLAWVASRRLPMMPNRSTGVVSRSTFTAPYVALVFCYLLSHPLLWGGLHHFHPGTPLETNARVIASGRRHGRAAHGHGDWVDLQIEGFDGIQHLETDSSNALESEAGEMPAHQCELKDTRAGDMLELQGSRSALGFAVMRFVPRNDRLLSACHPDLSLYR